MLPRPLQRFEILHLQEMGTGEGPLTAAAPSLFFLSDSIFSFLFYFALGLWGWVESVREGVPLVDLVLEDVEVVRGCYGDDVFMWVPRRVEDFLAEV